MYNTELWDAYKQLTRTSNFTKLKVVFLKTKEMNKINQPLSVKYRSSYI